MLLKLAINLHLASAWVRQDDLHSPRMSFPNVFS